MRLRHLWAVLMIVLFSQPALAQSPEDLEAALRYQGILMRVEFEATDRLEAGSLSEIRDLSRFLHEQTNAALEEAYHQSLIPLTIKDRSKELIKKINWSSLGQRLKTLGYKMKRMTRVHGLGVAAGRLVGTSMNLAILVTAGPKAAATTMQIFPHLGTGVGWLIQRNVMKRKMIQAYGSKEAVEQVDEARKLLAKDLGLASMTDILLPLSNGDSTFYSVLSQTTILERLKRWLGLRSSRLTYGSLVDELRAQNYASLLLEALEAQKSMPDTVKAALLLDEIVESGDTAMLGLLRERFPARFRDLAAPSTSRPRITEWIRSLEKARTKDEVSKLMSEVPEGLTVDQVLTLWREHLMPMFAMNIEDIDLVGYRRLVRQQPKLDALARHMPGQYWSEWWGQRFGAYYAESLRSDPGLANTCLRALTELIHL